MLFFYIADILGISLTHTHTLIIWQFADSYLHERYCNYVSARLSISVVVAIAIVLESIKN